MIATGTSSWLGNDLRIVRIMRNAGAKRPLLFLFRFLVDTARSGRIVFLEMEAHIMVYAQVIPRFIAPSMLFLLAMALGVLAAFVRRGGPKEAPETGEESG